MQFPSIYCIQFQPISIAAPCCTCPGVAAWSRFTAAFTSASCAREAPLCLHPGDDRKEAMDREQHRSWTESIKCVCVWIKKTHKSTTRNNYCNLLQNFPPNCRNHNNFSSSFPLLLFHFSMNPMPYCSIPNPQSDHIKSRGFWGWFSFSVKTCKDVSIGRIAFFILFPCVFHRVFSIAIATGRRRKSIAQDVTHVRGRHVGGRAAHGTLPRQSLALETCGDFNGRRFAMVFLSQVFH